MRSAFAAAAWSILGATAVALVLYLLALPVRPAPATWKPEFALHPLPVINWFRDAQVPGGYGSPAYLRLGITNCCEQSERLMTKFVGAPGKEWSYYPDPSCTVKGCALKVIPDDVVHDDGIHAAEPGADELPEFAAMRREGVLFIYHGEPSCFWPPEGNDN